MTMQELLRRAEKLDTDKVINEAFDESTEDFAEKNREQLFTGQTKAGGKITYKYRNNKYARVKNQMNPIPGLGTPDLKVTGSFYRGIRADVSGDVIQVQSTDEKGKDLEAKYADIFGLGGEFKSSFLNDGLGPRIQQKITTLVGLKFGKL